MFARRLVLPVSLLSAVLASSSTGAWADTTDPSGLPARAMVVFDRSNVKSPTDRPRVLFAVQVAPRRN